MKRLKLLFALGWSNLLGHRRRSALIGVAIAAITCLLVLLNALVAGINNTLIETATTLTTGHINVGGFYKTTPSNAAELIRDYERVVKVVEHAVPELELLVARGRGYGTVTTDRGSAQVGLVGIDVAKERRLREGLELVSGDFDALQNPNTLLIFESHARKLDVEVGDSVTISAQTLRGLYNTSDCKVVAIARDAGLLSKYSIFMPITTWRDLYQHKPNTTSALLLYLPANLRAAPELMAQRLRDALASADYTMLAPDPRAYFMKLQAVGRQGWVGQRLDVSTWQDEASSMSWSNDVFHALTVALMSVLITIVVTGITNTLWIAIRERTREIGSLRAIGMQRTGVMTMFLIESGMLGVLSASMGAALGALLALLLNAAKLEVPQSAQLFLMRDTLVLSIEPQALCSAVFSIALVTGCAALLPSLRAARLRPTDALSHVD